MTATERREEIMRIMVARREESMQVLARELGVTDRTIRNDILVLMPTYPLDTVRGNGGGVRLDKSYHPYRYMMTKQQTKTILNLKDRVSEEEWTVLEQLIHEHSCWAPELEEEQRMARRAI